MAENGRWDEQVLAYISGEMVAEERRDFEAHLHEDVGLRQKVEEMAVVWASVGNLPDEEPRRELVERYQSMMAGIEARAMRESVIDRIEYWLLGWWPRRPLLQVGFAFVFAACGVWGGAHWSDGQAEDAVGDVEQIMWLLNEVSTPARLQGVLQAGMGDGDDRVLAQALLGTLLRDPSVNVRRAAVSSLRAYSNRQEVRQVLARVLIEEESPIVRIALIRLIADVEGVEAIKTLEMLKEDRRVGEHARTALEKLL